MTPEVPFEEPTYPYLYEFCNLLGELTGLTSSLKSQGCLEDILKDEITTKNLEELSEMLPTMPINQQLLPLLSGISDLCLKVNSLMNTLENQGNTNQNTIYSSIHVPNSQPQPGPVVAHNTHTNPANPGQTKPTKKALLPATLTQPPNTPTNLRLAHHPTRIVAQFPPNGIPENDKVQ